MKRVLLVFVIAIMATSCRAQYMDSTICDETTVSIQKRAIKIMTVNDSIYAMTMREMQPYLDHMTIYYRGENKVYAFYFRLDAREAVYKYYGRLGQKAKSLSRF